MKKYYQPEDYCGVNVYRNGGRWSGSRCERRWKVEEGGKKYCIQHSPAKVKERQEASNAKDNKYWSDFHRRIVERQVCIGIPTEYLKLGILRKLIDFAYEMDNAALIDELEKE